MPVSLNKFKTAASLDALKGEGKNALKLASGKGSVKYVALRNFKMGNKFGTVFLVVEKPADFIKVMDEEKAKPASERWGGPTVTYSYGEAKVTSEMVNNKSAYKVVIENAKGGITASALSTLIKPAFGDQYVGTTEQRDQAEREAQESEQRLSQPNAQKPSPTKVAAKSMRQAIEDGEAARRAGQDDPDLMDKPGIHQVDGMHSVKEFLETLAKQRLQAEEFMKFAGAYRDLANRYAFEDNSLTIPGKVWLAMIQNMAKSGYVAANIPKGPDGRFLLRVEGPEGKLVREALLEKGMQGMQVFIQHASNNLDKVVKAVKANKGKTWAFWSGTGAKQAALKEASGGLVLEGSIGDWFKEIWEFEHLTGVSDMILWSSMSELYARKAAQYYKEFEFIGFMGVGSTKATTVWTNIEKPTLIQVLNVQEQVPMPKMRWFVVQLEKDNTGAWRYNGAPSVEFPNRGAAEAEVIKKYGE